MKKTRLYDFIHLKLDEVQMPAFENLWGAHPLLLDWKFDDLFCFFGLATQWFTADPSDTEIEE